MTREQIETLFEQLEKKHGKVYQMRILQEEASELSAGVSQFLRGKISLRDLCSEMADVEILLMQMRRFFSELIDEEKEMKLNRVSDMLKDTRETFPQEE